MRYEWDEEKRKSNLKDHSLDFVDVESVFAGPTFTFEDNRFAYHEQRFVTLGLLRGIPVSVVHTESGEVIRPISFAKPQTMKQSSSSRTSRTNYRRLRSLKSQDIRLNPEHPEADVRHVVRGIVRNGLKVVPPKRSVSLRIDADVLEWFKSTGTGYQTRINAVLRAYTQAAR